MGIPEDTRNILLSLGHLVTWTPADGLPVKNIPAVITDRPDSQAVVSGRQQRVAQIRVSKADVPAIGYRDTFTESDGTVWTVVDANRLINDRTAGTWRVICETGVRAKK